MTRDKQKGMSRKLTTAIVSGWIVALMGALIVIYGKYLQNPLVFDDIYFFDGRAHLPFLGKIFSLERRWLPYATFAWTRAIFGWDIYWYHLGNLILHIANAALLATLFFQLLDATRGIFSEYTSRWSAAFPVLAATSLFAVHPAAVYAVAYLTQRSSLLATLFTLVMLNCVSRAIFTNRMRWLWLSIPAYFLAVMSKEHAVMAPALALALCILFRHRLKSDRKLYLAAFAAYFLIAGFLVYTVKTGTDVIGTAYQVNGPTLLHRMAELDPAFRPEQAFGLSLITQATLFFKYVLIWILPSDSWMSVDMYEPLAHQWTALPQIVGALAFIIYGIFAIRLLVSGEKKGLIGFGLLFPWILFFTEFSTVRVAEPFVIYRSYLWFCGFFAVVLCMAALLRPKMLVAVAAAVTLALVPQTLLRIQTFSHPLFLWEDAARLIEGKPFIPGMERIYFNRANALSQMGDYAASLKDYDLVLQLDPTLPNGYSDRGAAKVALGDFAGAEADFKKALSIRPDLKLAWLGMARVFEHQGDSERAFQAYRSACQYGSALACNKIAKK